MGGGTTILLFYSVCCVGTVGLLGTGAALVYWGRWEERRRRRRAEAQTDLVSAAGNPETRDEKTDGSGGSRS